MIRQSIRIPLFLIVAFAFACIMPAAAFAEGQVVSQENPQDVKQLTYQSIVEENTVSTTSQCGTNSGPQDVLTQPADSKGSKDVSNPSIAQEGADQAKSSGLAASSVASSGSSTLTTPETQQDAEDAVLKAMSSTAKTKPGISYKAHVQNIGWQGTISDGGVAGSSGQSLRMEALTVTLNTGGYSGALQMKSHVQNIGWQEIMSSGATMGTTGCALRIEAIKLAITGEISRYYDIYYRAHVQNEGWQSWMSNGDLAGTTGKGLRIEALQIELRAKSKATSAQAEGIVGVRYEAHVQNIGWQGSVSDGNTAGTTGQSLGIEAVRIWIDADSSSSTIEYRAHVQDLGWLGWVKNGEIAGTTGRSLRLEAIEIRLTGTLASKFDIVYTAHIRNIGWQTAKNNSNDAGTTGRGLCVEALQVSLVKKSQRTGWFNENGAWNYYSSGSKQTGSWLVTSESPIEDNPGLQRYWLDTSGNLAVSRKIDPANSADKGSYLSYATDAGYVARNTIIDVDDSFYWANNDGLLSVPDLAKMIESAVTWAINTANDDSHGYSQDVRWGPDYDCSSFVISAFKNAGFQVGNAVYTGNMVSEMTKYGFTWSTDMSGLRRGDILLVHNDDRQHTELYIGNGQMVGAHIAETGGIYGQIGDQTGYEISVRDYYDAPWQGYLRASLA